MNWLPEEDGITHINLYSKGKTGLGRYLSNWSNIEHVGYRGVTSLEGYWFYLKSGIEAFRGMNGAEAKRAAKAWKVDGQFPKEKLPHFIDAMVFKILGEADNITEDYTGLPFTHYYVYGGKVVDAGFIWWVKTTEYLVQYFTNWVKQGKPDWEDLLPSALLGALDTAEQYWEE